MLLLLACSSLTPPARVEPSFVEVSLGAFEPGTAEAPLPFSSVASSVPVTVRTLDAKGELSPFDGDLTVKVRPGQLEGDPIVAITGGEWSGSVSLRNGFGPTRIWFTDEGDADETSERVPSWAVGVTPEIWYQLPTIAEVQATNNPETNQLDKEFANFRVDDRQIVVTAREAAGLWVTDTLDAPGSGNSLYVYTFGRPEDEYFVGARVTLLAGIDQEYLASTQLSYPTLEARGETLSVPDPVELVACDDATMEGLEGSKIRVSDGAIADTFVVGSEDYTDFETYGQWPLTSGTCTVYVDSGGTAPDFWPPDHVGVALPSVEGLIKQVFDKWVLVVVDAADIRITE